MHTSKHIRTTALASTLALTMIAGTAAAISPRNDPKAGPRDPSPSVTQSGHKVTEKTMEARLASDTARRTNTPLCYFSDLRGREIKGAAGDNTLGTVHDLLIDRYSGRVAGVVLSRGGILGVGDTLHLVRPGDLRTVDGDKALRVNMSGEAMDKLAEFDMDAWRAGASRTTSSDRDNADRASWWTEVGRTLGWADEPGRVNDGTMTNDADQGALLANARQATLAGTVTEVDRSGERARITVRTEEGDRVIDLGPVWFVSSSQAMPMRGEQVEVDARAATDTPGGTEAVWSAVTIRHEGGPATNLRDPNSFAGAWTNKSQVNAMNTVSGRFILATDLVGQAVHFRNDAVGEVQNLVVDHGSQRVRMLAIDPDENILGWGDTIRLVPFRAALVTGSEFVSIDATRDMIARAPSAPDDAADITQGDRIDRAFGFETSDSARYDSSRDAQSQRETTKAQRLAEEAAKAEASKQAVRDDGILLTGRIVRVETMDGPNDIERVKAIVISDGNSERWAIISGEQDYDDGQMRKARDADRVVVRTVTLKRNGGSWLAVRSIETADGKVLFTAKPAYAIKND